MLSLILLALAACAPAVETDTGAYTIDDSLEQTELAEEAEEAEGRASGWQPLDEAEPGHDEAAAAQWQAYFAFTCTGLFRAGQADDVDACVAESWAWYADYSPQVLERVFWPYSSVTKVEACLDGLTAELTGDQYLAGGWITDSCYSSL